LSVQLPLMQDEPEGHSVFDWHERWHMLLMQSLPDPAQVPQRRSPPQPSEMIPQFFPREEQVLTRQLGSVPLVVVVVVLAGVGLDVQAAADIPTMSAMGRAPSHESWVVRVFLAMACIRVPRSDGFAHTP
jgi:hypothetical protein